MEPKESFLLERYSNGNIDVYKFNVESQVRSLD